LFVCFALVHYNFSQGTITPRRTSKNISMPYKIISFSDFKYFCANHPSCKGHGCIRNRIHSWKTVCDKRSRLTHKRVGLGKRYTDNLLPARFRSVPIRWTLYYPMRRRERILRMAWGDVTDTGRSHDNDNLGTVARPDYTHTTYYIKHRLLF